MDDAPLGSLGESIDGLTPQQERAILALLSEHSVPKAARAAGVKERTIYRWLSDRDFGNAYRRCRREAFGQAVALTQRYAPLAVNTLARVMSDTTAPPGSRVSAANAIMRFGREGIELDDLAARVESIESTISVNGVSWRCKASPATG
jgi:hypothetical protein